MSAIRKFLCVLLLSSGVGELIMQVEALIKALQGNQRYAGVTPTFAEVTAQITALQTSESNVRARVRGAKKVRDADKAKLRTMVRHWGDYVQHLADDDPEHAQQIILEAGMHLKRTAGPSKPDFEALNGKNSGDVVLRVRRKVSRASFEWQSSTDLKTWTNLPSSLQAKTLIHGLTPVTMYYFRFRLVTKSGPGDWSEWVSLVVS